MLLRSVSRIAARGRGMGAALSAAYHPARPPGRHGSEPQLSRQGAELLPCTTAAEHPFNRCSLERMLLTGMLHTRPPPRSCHPCATALHAVGSSGAGRRSRWSGYAACRLRAWPTGSKQALLSSIARERLRVSLLPAHPRRSCCSAASDPHKCPAGSCPLNTTPPPRLGREGGWAGVEVHKWG